MCQATIGSSHWRNVRARPLISFTFETRASSMIAFTQILAVGSSFKAFSSVNDPVPDPHNLERVSDKTGVDEPGLSVGDRCPEWFMQISDHGRDVVAPRLVTGTWLKPADTDHT